MQRNELIEAIISYDVIDCTIGHHAVKLEQAIESMLEAIKMLTKKSPAHHFLNNLKDTLLANKWACSPPYKINAMELCLINLEIRKHIDTINKYVFSMFPDDKMIFFKIQSQLNSIKPQVNNIIKLENERISIKKNLELFAPKYARIPHEDKIEQTEASLHDNKTHHTLQKISVYPLHLSSQADTISLLLLNGADPNQCGYAKLPRTKDLVSRYRFDKRNTGANEYHERIDNLKTCTVFNNFLCFSSDYYERFNHVPAIISAGIEHDYQKTYTLASLNNTAKFKMTPDTISGAIIAIMNNSWMTEDEAQSQSPERKKWNDNKLDTLKLLIDLLDKKQLLAILNFSKVSNFNKDHHKIDFLKSAYMNKIQLSTWKLLSEGNRQKNSMLHHVPHDILKFIMSKSIDLDRADFSAEKIEFFKKVYSIMRHGDKLLSAHDFLHDNYNKSNDELMCLLLGKIEYEPESMTVLAWRLTGKHYLHSFTGDNSALVDDLINWYLANNLKHSMLNTSFMSTLFHDSLAERKKAVREEITAKIEKLNKKIENQKWAFPPVVR